MNNECNLFQEIRLSIISWVEENKDYFKENKLNTIILRNENDGFVVSFENDVAMAELVVERPSYAPYRFVSFEIAALEEDEAKIVYSWYDKENTSINEIKHELKNGIDYFIKL